MMMMMMMMMMYGVCNQGPLPVKWMAPESLYDQIYTTKSDVYVFTTVLQHWANILLQYYN